MNPSPSVASDRTITPDEADRAIVMEHAPWWLRLFGERAIRRLVKAFINRCYERGAIAHSYDYHEAHALCERVFDPRP